eukprot:TRINITY_DN194_c0_g1_i1.p2 TRINITY_DN194_c0_g1~~TRINITY_DN194_c0_g1_i1.p2  ORF type:complete len:332 (-),score=158.69 TRINITY_DN194_c0_g1_i1:119-1114(-)
MKLATFSALAALAHGVQAQVPINWGSVQGWWSFASDPQTTAYLTVSGNDITSSFPKLFGSYFGINFEVNPTSLKAFGTAATYRSRQLYCNCNFFVTFAPDLQSFNGTWVSTPTCAAPSPVTNTFVRSAAIVNTECLNPPSSLLASSRRRAIGGSAEAEVKRAPAAIADPAAAVDAPAAASADDATAVSLPGSNFNPHGMLRRLVNGKLPRNFQGLWSATIPNYGTINPNFCYFVSVLPSGVAAGFNATIAFRGPNGEPIEGVDVADFVSDNDQKNGYGRGTIYNVAKPGTPECTGDIYLNLDVSSGVIKTTYRDNCSGQQTEGTWVYSQYN